MESTFWLLVWGLGFLPPSAPPLASQLTKAEEKAEQLTFQGQNGEGYFSPDGKRLIFQSHDRPAHKHTQIYLLDLETRKERRLSHYNGDDTCSFFHPDGKTLMWSSTVDEIQEQVRYRRFDPRFQARKTGVLPTSRPATRKPLQRPSPASQPTQKRPSQRPLASGRPTSRPAGTMRPRRYEWIYKPYEVYLADLQGRLVKRLTHTSGYDAEGSFSPDGGWIAFSSQRDGDQELYLMRSDGRDQRRLTWRRGNDGGPFFSPEGKRLTWRSFDRRGNAQIFVGDLGPEGLTGIRQLTFAKGIHWAPYWHPDGKWLIFSGNQDDRRNFDLYLIDTEGTCQKRLTRHPSSDVLPVFSPDGKWIIWASKRGDGNTHLFRMPFLPPSKCIDPRLHDQPDRRLHFSPPPTNSP